MCSLDICLGWISGTLSWRELLPPPSSFAQTQRTLQSDGSKSGGILEAQPASKQSSTRIKSPMKKQTRCVIQPDQPSLSAASKLISEQNQPAKLIQHTASRPNKQVNPTLSKQTPRHRHFLDSEAITAPVASNQSGQLRLTWVSVMWSR